MISVAFEVHGKVQGVFFRKHTRRHATNLGVKGWCMNTDKGTVQGVIEGEHKAIEEMKRWLRHVGSPLSKIEKTEFHNEKSIPRSAFSDFQIRK